jgi:hypothetical protein
LTGLLNFLQAERRLTVNASSVFSQNVRIAQLLDIAKSYSYFSSKTGPDEWTELAIDGGHAQLTEYILRDWRGCPVSWVLWGSDAKGECVEIDRRTEDPSFFTACRNGRAPHRLLDHGVRGKLHIRSLANL